MPVSKRCNQHFENNCQHPYCVWDAEDARTNPARIRPKPTYGAPETSWQNPQLRTIELAQLDVAAPPPVAEKLPTPKPEPQLLGVPSILIASTPPRMDSLKAADINRGSRGFSRPLPDPRKGPM